MVIDMKFKGDKSAIDSVDKAIDELASSAKKASKEVDGLEKEVKDTGKTKPELEKVKQGLGGVGKGAENGIYKRVFL